jgi:hypothetical protein
MQMSKDFKSVKRAKKPKKQAERKLSFYLLLVESALGAALQTGRVTDQKRKKSVGLATSPDKSR